ncbi:hypothetical protein CW368_11990 [Actinomycetales bacterium SN12]|nr:hypothetical protein CW368_11990 [Actinomycetales bacterium SN12]
MAGALLGIKYDPGTVSDVSRHQRAAYNSARVGWYEEAAQHAGRAVEAAVAAGDTGFRRMARRDHAAYLGQVNGVTAQLVLDQASRNNPAVLTQLAGIV